MLKLNKVFLVDDALASINLDDRISVPTKRSLTDGGQMLVPCKFARTGSQKYLAGQVFTTKALLDQEGLKANDIIDLHRDEDTVFAVDSMESFRSAPVTLGHPKDDNGKPVAVTSENSKDLQVGVLEGMPVRDEDSLGGTLVLTAQAAIDALESGTEELSAGYGCDIVKLGKKYYQRNVRANHIAIVPKGRAGASCRMSDEALAVKEDDAAYDKEELIMGTKVEMEHTSDEEEAEVIAKQHLEEDPKYYSKLEKAGLVDAALLTDAQTLLADAEAELVIQKQLVVDFKAEAEKSELAMEAMKVELADAKVAASEGVVERCEVIEHARLIADMRDLGDKSVSEIRKLVVEDQYPEKDLSKKSEPFIEAMFEMLVDQAKGATPMSKLMSEQVSHVVVTDKHVDPVAKARANMIKRQSGKQSK
jgi:hypothetical protein